jgi:hypothetical protein
LVISASLGTFKARPPVAIGSNNRCETCSLDRMLKSARMRERERESERGQSKNDVRRSNAFNVCVPTLSSCFVLDLALKLIKFRVDGTSH